MELGLYRSVRCYWGRILGLVSSGTGRPYCPVLCVRFTRPASIPSWPTGPGSSEWQPLFLRGSSPEVGMAFQEWPLRLLARTEDHVLLGVGVGVCL